MKKLTKIQAELKAPKNQYNSFGKYKYRNQEDILEALKPILLKYECTLTITDEIKQIGDLIYCESTATISDGESKESVKSQAGIDPSRKGMDLAQCFGASSSYARKYALNGLFLIDDTKDVDTNEHSEQVTQMNLIEPPNEIVAEITKRLAGIQDLEDFKEFGNMQVAKEAKKFPNLKNMMQRKFKELKNG